MGDILTWYNNVDPERTVEIANYLRDQAASGNQIFYDIYTDEEKAEDPDKENTGLFFFRESRERRRPSSMQAADLRMWLPCTTAFPGPGAVQKGLQCFCPHLPARRGHSLRRPGKSNRLPPTPAWGPATDCLLPLDGGLHQPDTGQRDQCGD